jgi:hypothetical protein
MKPDFREYHAVRIAHLRTPDRPFDGTGSVARPPRIGDIGTIVHGYAAEGGSSLFSVEMVDSDGLTVWLPDFGPDELEHVPAEWYEPADPTPGHQCHCYDYVTLPERGMHLICPVCFPEDDGQDIDEIDQSSGPNTGITLREGRANFKRHGACAQRFVEDVLGDKERERFNHMPRSVV